MGFIGELFDSDERKEIKEYARQVAGLTNPLAETLDTGGNDVVDDGTTVYDASAETIGDGTTSADHQSVSTDSLENGVVGSGNTLTDVTGGIWETIDTASDSDSGTQFNPSFAGLDGDGYETYRLLILMEHTGTSSVTLTMQVSGNSTANYNFTQLGSASLSATTGASSWGLHSGFNAPFQAAYVLAGDDINGTSRLQEPTISKEYATAHEDDVTLEKGELEDGSALPVSSISLSTDDVTTGVVKLQGLIR